MSCLFAIGFQPSQSFDLGLRPILNALAFSPVDQSSHDYVQELAAKGKELSPQTQWFIAVDSQGLPDFEIAYDLPAALKGRLGVILNAVEQTMTTTTCEILFYDLGTSEMNRYDGLGMRDMKQTLFDWYEKGSPVGSVYHKFTRKGVGSLLCTLSGAVLRHGSQIAR